MRSHRPSLRSPALAAASLLLALAPVLFTACIGGTGTGTDTDNGIVARVVDSDGGPLPGVHIALHTPDFRPDSGAVQDLVVDASKPLVSDSLGYVRFELLRPGKYVVEGRRDSASLFFDTLAIADVKALAPYTFRARPTGAVKGAVRLASGLQVDSGRIFIRGTARFARLDRAGAYDLGALPVDVGNLAIGVVYQASVRETRVAELKADTTKSGPVTVVNSPVFACREVSADSAAKLAAASDGSAETRSPADTIPRLDSAKVAAVARSCQSLETGTVISVRTPAPVPPSGTERGDSLTTQLIAVRKTLPVTTFSDRDTVSSPVLVSLNGCVSAPGTTQTTYAVSLVPTAAGSDLAVADVAGACLAK